MSVTEALALADSKSSVKEKSPELLALITLAEYIETKVKRPTNITSSPGIVENYRRGHSGPV